MTAPELLERLQCDRGTCECHRALRRQEGRTHCPAHDDRNPSLAVKVQAGQPLWHCHGGCSQEAVTAAIAELEGRSRPAPQTRAGRSSSNGARKREVASYDYTDEEGRLLYQAVRFEPKDFRQRKPSGDGWSWSLNGVRRVLYGLPELFSETERAVYLVEGEKDADRLRELGLLATCYAGGVKAPWQPDWTEQLRGRRVVVLPDSDLPGLQRALRDAGQLAGAVDKLKILQLPELEVQEDHGQDVSDWLEAGHDVAELKYLAAEASAWSPADVAEAEREIFGGQLEEAEVDPDPTPAPEARLVVRRPSELSSLGADLVWNVERFLAAGAVSELTAYIKTGKSTVMYQLIAAVLQGTVFLDRFPARRGSVVLLSEEPPVSLRMGLEDADIEAHPDLHLVLWRENQLPWADAARLAAGLCQEVGARLLVVDTLSWWANVQDENASGDARQAMEWLLSAAGQGLSVLSLRQARKSGGEIHNAGRGSGAFGGAADILLHLDYWKDEKKQPLEDDPRRELRIKSRLEREHLPMLKLNYEHGRYQLTEHVASAGERLNTLKLRVLQAIREAPEPLAMKGLQEAVPARKSDLLKALDALVEQGRVAKQEREHISQPYRYAVVPGFPEQQGTTGTTEASAAVPVVPTTPEQLPLTRARAVVPAGPSGQLGKPGRERQGTPPGDSETPESPPVVPVRLELPGNNTAPDPGDRCPRCRQLDYTPRADGRRHCACGHLYRPAHVPAT